MNIIRTEEEIEELLGFVQESALWGHGFPYLEKEESQGVLKFVTWLINAEDELLQNLEIERENDIYMAMDYAGVDE